MNRREMMAVLAACALSPLIAQGAQGADLSAIASAQQAASQWMTTVDAKDFSKSWEQAATAFRRALTQSQWAQAVDIARGPLGAVKSRSLVRSQPASTLPGAPDGDYVVLEFQTSFEHKAAAVETTVMVKDTDGSYRAVGYFVR